MIYKYEIESRVFTMEATDRNAAYAAMVLQARGIAPSVVLHEPSQGTFQLSCPDEVFGGDGAFDSYAKSHASEIISAYMTIREA